MHLWEASRKCSEVALESAAAPAALRALDCAPAIAAALGSSSSHNDGGKPLTVQLAAPTASSDLLGSLLLHLLPTAQVEEEGGHGAREHDADEADGLSGSRSGDELARRSVRVMRLP